ncbi:uncharacterized protein LOC131042698 isoform X2 [Cryptomeria japonica]|uniref:uncharacterized protein LOC131042698 isoform X2 n=1 Tax=Cryptomeria japonica TaxID=3369 RepID=UPI0027DA1340|nr:uncharacterized protein LOC131042698 isoform X2 [Cryptomeria japonica]
MNLTGKLHPDSNNIILWPSTSFFPVTKCLCPSAVASCAFRPQSLSLGRLQTFANSLCPAVSKRKCSINRLIRSFGEIVGKCNRNEAVLSIPYNESAQLVPPHHTMSDICPPEFSIWTAEDDLVLKNAVEPGTGATLQVFELKFNII